MTQHIAMFGGAFDPPHLAHRALAEAALTQLPIDVLHVMPTGEAWHKNRALTGAAYRLAMCRLAFEGLPKLRIDDREIRRIGPSYTLDTLRELQLEDSDAKFFLIMGQDQAQALPTWRHWREIVAIATICVADRDLLTGRETGFTPPPELASQFQKIQMPAMDISATGIRARAATGQGIEPLVSPAVARYIEDHHLYLNP